MTQIKKTKSEIFVIFSSEIRECPFFAFSEEQKPCKKVPDCIMGGLNDKEQLEILGGRGSGQKHFFR